MGVNPPPNNTYYQLMRRIYSSNSFLVTKVCFLYALDHALRFPSVCLTILTLSISIYIFT